MANPRYCVHCLHHRVLSCYQPTLFSTGLIVPILNTSALNRDIAQHYLPITLSSIYILRRQRHWVLSNIDFVHIQFGFSENRGTSIACNFLNVFVIRDTQGSFL